MKLDLIILMFLLFGFSNCSNQNKLNGNVADVNVESLIYPIKIEFGAVGKGSKSPPTIIKIDRDSVRVSATDRYFKMNVFSIETKETKFEEVLSSLDAEDIKDDKHYYHPFIRDGGYMNISNELGNRKFTNTFSKNGDKSNIKPDTIGLTKFEMISNYANSFLKEIENKK